MDEDILERIRADAERLDHGYTDVDALVDRALLGGRRRRTRRRFAGAATVVAVGVAITVLGVNPTALHSGPRVVPAAPVPQASMTSSPSRPTKTPTPRVATSTAPAVSGRVSGSPADVRRTLTGLLPDGARVTHASAERDEGSDGFAWEHSAALTVRDGQGTTYVLGGIGNDSYQDGCFNLDDCTKTSLPQGGTLWVSSSPAGDKSGVDLMVNYNRPDGGHIWMMERNYATGSGPVTRDGLLLSRAAGRGLVTSQAWDALFRG